MESLEGRELNKFRLGFFSPCCNVPNLKSNIDNIMKVEFVV